MYSQSAAVLIAATGRGGRLGAGLPFRQPCERLLHHSLLPMTTQSLPRVLKTPCASGSDDSTPSRLDPRASIIPEIHIMAEAAAAFYTVETAVEGAAVGAFAVAKPTVPIVVRFHRIKSPSQTLALSSHSLSYYKGRAYVFGGDYKEGPTDNVMHVITLPANLDLSDTDYRFITAEPAPARPLEPYTRDPDAKTATSLAKNVVPMARAAHAATAIASNIFILGGRAPRLPTDDYEPSLIDEQGTVHVFSAIDNKWTTLIPNMSLCTSGVPEPRTYGSMTGSSHPLPQSNFEVTSEAYGTLFLHGGYASGGKFLRDTWAFDVSSRAWSLWPTLPTPGVEEVAGEGRIYCTESRLWRVGDGFGKMSYLELSRDIANDFSGKSEIGVTPKTGQWTTLSFGTTAKAQIQGEKHDSSPGPTTRADDLPIPRKHAGFLPATTGAGREFLLYFMGEDAPGSTVPDIWTFQIAADKSSAALLKDKIRTAFGAATGEHQWARCDVVQASKQEGEIERPQGLTAFAAESWTDFGGGAAVIWGGKDAHGDTKNEGWVLTVD